MTAIRLALGVFAVLFAAAASAAGEPAVTLRAEAGLDGIARPGRWLPIRIEVTSASDIAGALVVSWGDVTVTRDLAITAGRRTFEIYTRTVDPRDLITVRLNAADATLAHVTVPVHVIPYEEPVNVCGSQPSAADESPCTTSLATRVLPHSWRGYDAADDVRLAGADLAAADAEQRRAYAFWRAVHRLDLLGLAAPDVPAVPSNTRLALTPRTLTIAYSLLLLAGAVTATRTGRRRALLPVVVMLAIAGCGVLTAAGRLGPGSSVVTHYAAAAQQFEEADGALMSARGTAEYPALDDYALRSEVADASLTAARPVAADHAAARFDADGFPVLTSTAALGSARSFVFEGYSPENFVSIARQGQRVQLRNISALPLTNCAFSLSFSRQAVGDLAPGASIDAEQQPQGDDATFSCDLVHGPVPLSETRHDVVTDARATLVVHFLPVAP